MAVSDVYTWNLLNRWPVLMLESPWHFNQVTGQGAYAPLSHPCDDVYIQSQRDYIARALYVAAQESVRFLGFYARPTWQTTTITLRARAIPTQVVLSGYLQAFGRRATTLIDADAAIVFSDADGDGVDDTGTITVPTSVTDPDEIQVFFRVTDGAPGDADERWQIEPATVEITGGNATITVKRWLLAHPTDLWAKPYVPPNYNERFVGDTQTQGHFVTAVDVYRVYNDTANAITFRVPSCDGCGASTDTAIEGCGDVEDGKLGLARIALRSGACLNASRPIKVEIDYLAGYPLQSGMMERELEETLIRLSNCKMPQQPGNFCDRTLTMWQVDTLPVPAERLNVRDVNNPIGIREGEIHAWKVFQHRALGRAGVSL